LVCDKLPVIVKNSWRYYCTRWAKNKLRTLDHIFTKYWRTFKILSLLHWAANLQ